MKTKAPRSVYHPAAYKTQHADQGTRVTHSRTTKKSSRRHTQQQPWHGPHSGAMNSQRLHGSGCDATGMSKTARLLLTWAALDRDVSGQEAEDDIDRDSDQGDSCIGYHAPFR